VTAWGRRGALGLGLAGVALVAGAGLLHLPPSGGGRSEYADLAVSRSLPARHAQDVVAAINFDFRGFDTLGEEFILFAAVVGVATLLRERRQAHGPLAPARDRSHRRAPLPTSAAVRALGAGLTGLTVCFGLYMISHGQVSPGGGFQGGVVLATAPLAVYLSMEARVFLRIAPRALVALGEGTGAAAFCGIGLLGLAAGRAYLENVLPMGTPGDLLSAGTIQASNLAVGVAVACGLVLILTSFVDEALERRLRRRDPR
jgi:multicomponent Na+:H+ antiporter subunit B